MSARLRLLLPFDQYVDQPEAQGLVDGDHVLVGHRVEGTDLAYLWLRRHQLTQIFDLDEQAEPVATVVRVDQGDPLPDVLGHGPLPGHRRPSDDPAGAVVPDGRVVGGVAPGDPGLVALAYPLRVDLLR